MTSGWRWSNLLLFVFFERLIVSRCFEEFWRAKVELTWTLFTGAGFEIDRDGFAVMTQLTPGGPLQILWGGVVSTRFKEMKDTLLQIVKSFRCAKVPQGIKIDMKKEYKDFSTNFREER